MSVSSRVLRRIRGDDNALAKAADDGSDIDDAPFSTVPRANLNINRYDLLNDETQSESEVKEDDDRDADSAHHRRPGHDTRISKRKKKKKKRKSLPASQKHSSEDIDEVERSVREVNAILGHTVPGPAPADAKTAAAIVVERGILAVERKHLNPKNELKRIFGSDAVQGTETHKGRGRNRGHVKNIWLVPQRKQWSMLSGPYLTMSQCETVDGVQYFKYDHSLQYQSVERRFLACVESMEPVQLMMIANQYPLHVNTLIQLSEICKMNEEYPSAAQLIERALYSLEYAFHPMFSLSRGNCRLDYRRQENRALFIALFNHLRYVGQRACYRTALEFCKLLLSLSPDDDPLAIVLALDFYAIRAREYRWLLNLIEETEARRNLSQLPNMAFGRALAHFHLDEVDKADELLQDALIMFPGVLIPLLEKCSISPDAKTLASYFFMDACNRQSPALTQLVQLYVGRSYHLYKEAKVLRWLEKNTLSVLERAAKSDPLIPDYAAKRTKRFECKTPRAVQRHVLLSDIPDVSVTETGTTFNFDPLPPLDTVNIYKGPERPQRFEDLGSTVSLFFRSMLPSFSGEALEAPVEEEPEPQEEGAAGGADPASLRRSVTTLLDAMRDLITNLQAQNDADAETTDGSGAEEDA